MTVHFLRRRIRGLQVPRAMERPCIHNARTDAHDEDWEKELKDTVRRKQEERQVRVVRANPPGYILFFRSWLGAGDDSGNIRIFISHQGIPVRLEILALDLLCLLGKPLAPLVFFPLLLLEGVGRPVCHIFLPA